MLRARCCRYSKLRLLVVVLLLQLPISMIRLWELRLHLLALLRRQLPQ